MTRSSGLHRFELVFYSNVSIGERSYVFSTSRMRRADIEVPNLAVAMNAWARLACYPRGNFYPLNKGASTRHLRVTMPHFRDCSTCQSRSKAGLYHCALQLISIQLEPTFGILRYSLVRYRPSQTAPLTLFLIPDYGPS